MSPIKSWFLPSAVLLALLSSASLALDDTGYPTPTLRLRIVIE